jgi:RND family efflux transporter MFP subunit
VDVQVAQAVTAVSPGWYEAGGVVQARLSSTLTSRIVAPVVAVRVNPGDRVHAGQLLVELDSRELAANARRALASSDAADQATRAAQSECEAADAAVLLADTNLRRITRLQERRSATQQELDEATASARAATARATSARAQIEQATAAAASARAASDTASVTASYARITAPFDGLITEKLIEPGNMAAPGTPLLRLEATDGFRVEVRMDESRAALVSPGQTLAVSIRSGSEARVASVLWGTVTELARAIDADARTSLVKIRIDAAAHERESLRSGMFATVQLPGPLRQTLRVPASAIVRHGQVATVFVIDKDQARLRLVQAGATDSHQTEILSGLDAGEVVVVSPPPVLVDRTPVRVTSLDPLADAAPRAQEGSQ